MESPSTIPHATFPIKFFDTEFKSVHVGPILIRNRNFIHDNITHTYFIATITNYNKMRSVQQSVQQRKVGIAEFFSSRVAVNLNKNTSKLNQYERIYTNLNLPLLSGYSVASTTTCEVCYSLASGVKISEKFRGNPVYLNEE